MSPGDLESSPSVSNKTVTVAVTRSGHRNNKSCLAVTCVLQRICLLGRNRQEATAQHSATEAEAEKLEQRSQDRVCVEMGPSTQRLEISYESEVKLTPQLRAVTANTNQQLQPQTLLLSNTSLITMAQACSSNSYRKNLLSWE